jgi:hypothetical protein
VSIWHEPGKPSLQVEKPWLAAEVERGLEFFFGTISVVIDHFFPLKHVPPGGTNMTLARCEPRRAVKWFDSALPGRSRSVGHAAITLESDQYGSPR